MSNFDAIFSILFGIAVFIGIWGYAFYKWGILKSLTFGWIPALVGGSFVFIILVSLFSFL
jgi:hypothetical protein